MWEPSFLVRRLLTKKYAAAAHAATSTQAIHRLQWGETQRPNVATAVPLRRGFAV